MIPKTLRTGLGAAGLLLFGGIASYAQNTENIRSRLTT